MSRWFLSSENYVDPTLSTIMPKHRWRYPCPNTMAMANTLVIAILCCVVPLDKVRVDETKTRRMHRDRRGRESDHLRRLEVSRIVENDRQATRWFLLLSFFHDEQMDSSDGARSDGRWVKEVRPWQDDVATVD